jgi:GR25 family glycosyltransferase involved in LPS biosynthesis
MVIHFINLDRTPDRCREFLQTNRHISQLSRFPAVDGTTLDPDALVRNGTIAAGIRHLYSPGALGVALSHLALWEKAIQTGQPITVCEDDAIFHQRFPDLIKGMMRRLPANWDFLLWGWNLDAELAMDLLPGVSPCFVVCDQDQMRIGFKSSRRFCCRRSRSDFSRLLA